MQDWERARELTLAAEREAAEAKLSGGKANKELAAAEAAEDAVRKAQAKHREVGLLGFLLRPYVVVCCSTVLNSGHSNYHL